MPRVLIVTDQGEEVGTVPVFETSPRAAKYGHGWDGIEFERLWSEARRRENVAEAVAEQEMAPHED